MPTNEHMAILVTGGAGYIGSVTVDALVARAERPIVLDNLVYGHREAVDADVPFYKGDIGDRELVAELIRTYSIDECIHFSAYAYVGESVTDPAKYYQNNVAATLELLDVLREQGVRRVIFSSTCATYGEPQYTPIDENHPQQPANPYGWSKLMVERILASFDAAYGLRYAALRYFNAAGATELRGEDHTPETHLIPLALAAAAGKIPNVSIYGVDYPTPDGTAIRDYIHVADLADAHISALERLRSGAGSDVFNLGNGSGYSVLEVIDSARRVTGCDIEAAASPRRPGDPAVLVANADKARSILDWQPSRATLDEIVASAWAWHQKNPDGYQSGA